MLGTIFTFLFVLLILVLFHEAGHFTAAKILGIKVEEFGFGLPPRITGKKIGETLYSLNWLPIGGFVKLYGEDAEQPQAITKQRERAFFYKSPWQRFIVLTAGVFMNFMLGWAVLSFLMTQGILVPKGIVTIEDIASNSPAFHANLQKGDSIKKIQTPDQKTVQIQTNQELIATISRYLDKKLVFTILRDGKEFTVEMTPRKNHPENQGALGIVISDVAPAHYTLSKAPIEGLKYSWFIMTSTIKGIGDSISKLITRQTSKIQVAGIVGIGQIVGEARKYGLQSVLYVVAVLSLNLSLINLLPFPALDGGRVVFVIYEALTGKKVNARFESYLHQIGMIILLILMLIITFNDIIRLQY